MVDRTPPENGQSWGGCCSLNVSLFMINKADCIILKHFLRSQIHKCLEMECCYNIKDLEGRHYETCPFGPSWGKENSLVTTVLEYWESEFSAHFKIHLFENLRFWWLFQNKFYFNFFFDMLLFHIKKSIMWT